MFPDAVNKVSVWQVFFSSFMISEQVSPSLVNAVSYWDTGGSRTCIPSPGILKLGYRWLDRGQFLVNENVFEIVNLSLSLITFCTTEKGDR